MGSRLSREKRNPLLTHSMLGPMLDVVKMDSLMWPQGIYMLMGEQTLKESHQSWKKVKKETNKAL